MLPKHVDLSRQMLDNILYGRGITIYRHTNGPVIWYPSYISITDCSGYINALLQQSYNLPIGWSGSIRPYASTYYRLINNQTRFDKFGKFDSINNINNVQIGDLIVFKNLHRTPQNDNTGHIMIVNSLPISVNSMDPIDPIQPIIPNTYQWIIQIIDQSSAHGTNDTRYNGKYNNGLGRGYFRIYVDGGGKYMGYTWSSEKISKYINHTDRPIVIGRFIN